VEGAEGRGDPPGDGGGGDGEPLLHFGESFSPEQQRALLRVVGGLRRAIAASVSLAGSADALARLADRAEAFAGEVELGALGRPVPLMTPWQSAPALSGMLPYSPIMGRANPIAPPLWLERSEGSEGVRAVGLVTLGDAYQGAQGIAHGGVVASLWDEVLAFGTILGGVPGPTGELRVTYRRPTPLHRPLRFESWVEGSEGRRVFARGVCTVDGADGQPITEASGTFIRFGPDSVDASWVERGKDFV